MGERLPDDLERLGNQLTTAAERKLSARRRRSELSWRLATTGVVGALAFAVLTPAALEPAQRGDDALEIAALPAADAKDRMACDQPRGAQFGLPACTVATDGTARILHRTYANR
jgi:hypothetical protein